MSGLVVYGLRERGTIEIRYVGQTHSLTVRMHNHRHILHRMPVPKPFALWFRSADVESVVLARCDTRDEARAQELSAIRMFAAAGNRLFNRKGLPPELRIAA